MSTLPDENFKQIYQDIPFPEETKTKLKLAIMDKNETRKKSLIGRIFIPIFLLVIFSLLFILLSETNEITQGEITDTITSEMLSPVEVTGNLFTIEWLSDAMDRGNHDLQSNVHGNLVITPNVDTVARGEILYYETNGEMQIGRVVGLAGEQVEIREGQVYIDRQKLNTFYGVATSYGLTEAEYFAAAPAEQINEAVMREHFQTTVSPVKVEENEVYVLVDTWWRGLDSRKFGAISKDNVVGKIIGYEN